MLKNKLIVWALFDSGNGCYKKVADSMKDVEIYSIGLDRENQNSHFINLNLADYSYLFGDCTLYTILDKLPKPDLIIASPPCESWSVASAMFKGNACWKSIEDVNLFGNKILTKFCIRDYTDYERYQYKPENQIITRINGELCIYNTIKIIKKYNPKFYIIENPAYGKIWEYMNKILGFKWDFDNLTYYNNYGFSIKKPTKFASNVDLELNSSNQKGRICLKKVSNYNERSNIPFPLVQQIFETIKRKVNI